MKKALSALLAVIMILMMCPGLQVAAAQTAQSIIPAPQYIALDFEEGIEDSGVIPTNGKATWLQTDAHNNSKGALYYTTKTDFSSAQFPLCTIGGDTYHISLWVKFDEVPKSQKLEFVINNEVKANGKNAWNEIAAEHAPIEAGKWVEVTATYVCDGKGGNQSSGSFQRYPVYPNGTIELRLGSGVVSECMPGTTFAYAIDDFYVYPDAQNNIDESNLFVGGLFDTEEEMRTNWTTNGGAKISFLADEGAYHVDGNGQLTEVGSMHVDTLSDWGSPITKYPIPFQYGKMYSLFYFMRATSEDAVGLKPMVILTYPDDRAEGTPQYEHISYQYSGALTTEWQIFAHDIKIDRILPEKTYPTLMLRVGDGTQKCSYDVDCVTMRQYEARDFDVEVTGHGSAKNPGDIEFSMKFHESTVGTFLYRLYDETENGDVLLRKGHTDEGLLTVSGAEIEGSTKLRLDVVGADSYGNCTKIKKVYVDDLGYEDSVSLRSDQYIWNNDIKTLSATVRYQNETTARQIVTYAAQYNEDNKLVSALSHTEMVPAYTDKTWSVKMTADPTAVKVKYFTWADGTQKPVTANEELTKTTSGEFIYVDINSKASSADGSFKAPYKSLNAARNRIRNRVSTSPETEIYVVFKGGEYVPTGYATMEMTSRDFAENKHVIYTSLNSDRAKITGAKHLTGFTLHDESKNIYRTSVPAGTQTRQLYVNGIKATRARSPEDAIPFVNLDLGNSDAPFYNYGLTSTDTSFLNYKYPNELELYFTQNWRHQFVMVDTITQRSDGLVHFGFTENESQWKKLARINTYARLPVYVENAYELLDEPGEWYLDTHENYIYYMPREFENMATADVVIPGMEKLIDMTGTPDAPIKNISFRNIDFEYTTWNKPTEDRHLVSAQHATYRSSIGDNGGRLIDAALELHNIHNITFDNCDFSKMGAMALKMTGAVQHCNVIGNEFYELAGSAINLGEVTAVGGVSVRYPPEEKYYVTDNLIANNYIHKIGTEQKSAAAIGAGFPKNTVIRNNDLSDGPYSGMHIGWGWDDTSPAGTENFSIEKNYIHDFMNWRLYDGGGIYTLGKTGGTKENPNYLRGNYFVDIQNHYGSIYPDEGSTGWSIYDNVIDQHHYPVHYGTENSTGNAKWLHIWTTSIRDIWLGKNYSTASAYREDGTGIEYVAPELYPTANWPDEALKLIEEAGIEKEYLNRFDFNLQTIRIPRLYEVSVDQTVPLLYDGISSKNRIVDLSDYEITATSSNPAIATATSESVTGHSAGTAWITFRILKREGGKVVHYDEHTFRVVVK